MAVRSPTPVYHSEFAKYVQGALEAMGLNLEELIDEENDPGLSGGLGRLHIASSILWRR
ncbi:hypothetical protein ACLB1Q_24410 [Escherichia coli]